MPENAAGWLFRVAHNAAIDAVRRDRIGGQKSAEVVAALSVPPDDTPEFESQLRDDQLRLVFMCCHPRIPRDGRAVLSLQIAGGFNVREIARAFLAEDAAIAQRLVRARRQIREQGLTLDMPDGEELKRRLDSVFEVIYLMFNEGYAAHEGADLIRTDLCHEALRLGQLIATSSIAEPRAHALMALMALQAARLPARTDEAGDLILLEDQDRSRWDEKLVHEGLALLDKAMRHNRPGPYQVQAAIAATHSRAASAAETNWAGIEGLYLALERMQPSPVITLNRAVAVAKLHGPQAALDLIAPLEQPLSGYFHFFGARGAFLLQLGRNQEARADFDRAIALANTPAEAAHIRHHLDRLMATSSNA